MATCVINDGKLAWSNALNVLLAIDDPLAVTNAGKLASHDMGRVAVLKHDINRSFNTFPRITRDEVHLIKPERAAILLVGTIAVGDVDDVLIHILAYYIPWSTTQSQALALTNGVEPITTVLA